MDGLAQPAITASITVVTGTIIYVVTQLLSKLSIEPAAELRKTIGEIDVNLTVYSDMYSNLGSDLDETAMDRRLPGANTIRELAAKLRAQLHTIRWYKAAKLVASLPQEADVLQATRELIGLSNHLIGWRGDEMAFANLCAVTARKLLGLAYSQHELEVFTAEARRRLQLHS